MIRNLFIITLFTFVFSPVWAGELLAEKKDYYYGENMHDRNLTLKTQLHRILNSFHISQENSYDEIVKYCELNENERCYNHRNLGYKKARQHMFGEIYLKGIKPHTYRITSLYCGDQITNENLSSKGQLGPLQIPDSRVLNTEHSWPQSKFTKSGFTKSIQKADMHALFPVRSSVNSTRGNHPYGEVVEVTSLACPDAALGKDHKGSTVFEPAESVKGDVARATFYFSTRYKIKIGTEQERVLRRWHQQDPVDQEEIKRNEIIFELQHVRNPYIDNPHWVNEINDF